MSNPEDLALIDRFLLRVRQNTQWFENRQPLAPGDITPYLQTVMTAALGTLCLNLPQGSLEIVRASHPQTNAPLPAKWWTFRYAGHLFDIEGPVAQDKIDQTIREQLNSNGMPRNTAYCLTRERTPDVAMLFAQAQGTGLKVLQIVNEAWASQFEAPKLRQQTVQPQTKSRPQGRL